jgi:hypothetical protein
MTQGDDEFHRLNREFYAGMPSAYFRDRLTLLAIRAARTDALDTLMDEGITWGQIRIGGQESEQGPQDNAALEAAARERFVVTESQILLHHASEALLRMFLAHEGQPECPWIEMASLLNFREFRASVAELAGGTWSAARLAEAAEVFIGFVPDDPPAEWTLHRDAAVRLIRVLANHLSSDANLYNSAKHGLTSLAGTGSLTFVSESGEALLGADGVNVAFLEREGTKKSGFTWFHNTKWVRPEKAGWLTHLAIVQMEALWAVAKWRYLGEAPPDGQIKMVTNEGIDIARDGFQPGG